jgi:hypothetical protein
MSDDRMSEKWIEHWVKTNPDRDRARAVGMVFPGDPGYVEPSAPPTPVSEKEAFMAGYHASDQGRDPKGRYHAFDPGLDPEGAYAAWVSSRGR